ncbi:hypothetical protein MBRA1_000420 [Malassezia brasiliensis]|uniref:Inositol polyphosphate-related phosphatase domain-containing protein n=1 Tax=Malassezia brasiliensis TaxID=1821822 RepID=A0AAF0IMB6_9BASI|nr:hypothetical protein MBRA1_000420 [Malassezia brasiliensis]
MAAPPRADAVAPTDAQQSATHTHLSTVGQTSHASTSYHLPPPPGRLVRAQSDHGAVLQEAPPPPPKTSNTHVRDRSIQDPVPGTSVPPSYLGRSVPPHINVTQTSQPNAGSAPSAPRPLDLRTLSKSLPGQSVPPQDYFSSHPARAEWNYDPSRGAPDAWVAEHPREKVSTPLVLTHEMGVSERTGVVATREMGHKPSSSVPSLPQLPEGAVPAPPDAYLYTSLHDVHAEAPERAVYVPHPRHPASVSASERVVPPRPTDKASRPPAPSLMAPAMPMRRTLSDAPPERSIPSLPHSMPQSGALGGPVRPRIEIPPIPPMSQQARPVPASVATPRTEAMPNTESCVGMRRRGFEMPAAPETPGTVRPGPISLPTPTVDRVRGPFSPTGELMCHPLPTPITETMRGPYTPVHEVPRAVPEHSRAPVPATGEAPLGAFSSSDGPPGAVRQAMPSGTSLTGSSPTGSPARGARTPSSMHSVSASASLASGLPIGTASAGTSGPSAPSQVSSSMFGPSSTRTVDNSDTPTISTTSSSQGGSSDDDDDDDVLAAGDSSSDEEGNDTLPDTTLTTPSEATDPNAQDEMLDPVQVNRLPPYPLVPCDISFKSMVHAGDLFGHLFAVAKHDKIRVMVRGEGPNGYIEKVFAQGAEHYAALGSPTNLSATSREFRSTMLAFCPPIAVAASGETPAVPSEAGDFVWYGTTNGNVGEFNVHTGQLTAVRTNIHKERICLLQRVGHAMLIVDESGKISAWVPRHGRSLSLAHTTPHSQRITLPKHSYVALVGDQLWVCTVAMSPKSNTVSVTQKTLYMRIYNPLADDRPFNALTQPLTLPLTKENGVGGVTCFAVVPEYRNTVFFGHDSGHISVWTIDEPACTDVHRMCTQPITAMTGINSMLWIGTRSGHITLYDVRNPVWRAAKRWRAHRDAVAFLLIDRYGIDPRKQELSVCSVGYDSFAHFWDAFLTEDWTDNELRKLSPTFSMPCMLRVLELTYNIGAASPSSLFGLVDNMELFQRVLRNSCTFSTAGENAANEYCDAYNSPDIIVFGFQELIDLEDKRLTAKRLLLGNRRRERKDFDNNISSQHKAWHDQLVNFVRLVLPPEAPYSVLLSESMVGLFSMVFVKTNLREHTRDEMSYQVKTGLGGHYGNKGALVSRFLVYDTSFCFINCHLAAGQRNVRQRNSDIGVILQSSFPVTPPNTRSLAYTRGGDGTLIGDHEICFIAGDLNYRIDLSREAALSLVREQRFDELTAADQLLNELRSNPTLQLRGFQEAPIHFPPTYKFNRRSNDWDSSEKARVPAYCDRILWRGSTSDMVQCTSYKRWDATISDHRPVSATFRVRTKDIDPARFEQATLKVDAECAVYKQRVLHDTLTYFLSL